MDKSKLISKEDFIKEVSSYFLTKDPVTKIHHELKKMIENGYNRDNIYILVQEYLTELQTKGSSEREEDIMTDVITFFDGWSLPEWQL